MRGGTVRGRGISRLGECRHLTEHGEQPPGSSSRATTVLVIDETQPYLHVLDVNLRADGYVARALRCRPAWASPLLTDDAVSAGLPDDGRSCPK
jgi:hypothetical protein